MNDKTIKRVYAVRLSSFTFGYLLTFHFVSRVYINNRLYQRGKENQVSKDRANFAQTTIVDIWVAKFS